MYLDHGQALGAAFAEDGNVQLMLGEPIPATPHGGAMCKITQVAKHAAIADICLFADIVAFVERMRTDELEDVLDQSRGQSGDVVATCYRLDGVVDTGALGGESGARPEVVEQAHDWGGRRVEMLAAEVEAGGLAVCSLGRGRHGFATEGQHQITNTYHKQNETDHDAVAVLRSWAGGPRLRLHASRLMHNASSLTPRRLGGLVSERE